MLTKTGADLCVPGDASRRGDMLKLGFSVNISSTFPNTCWSLISPDKGKKVSATYEQAKGWHTSITTDRLGRGADVSVQTKF